MLWRPLLAAVFATLLIAGTLPCVADTAEDAAWKRKKKCERIHEAYLAPEKRAEWETYCKEIDKKNNEYQLDESGNPRVRKTESTPELREINRRFTDGKYAYFDDRDAEAAELFGKAAALMAKVAGEESAAVETILYRQALSLQNAQKYKEAAELYEKAFAMSVQGNRLNESDFSDLVSTDGSVDKAEWLNELAQCYKQLKEYSRMISTYQKLRELPKSNRGRWSEPRVVMNIARAYDFQNKYKEASELWSKWLADADPPEDAEIIDKVQKERFRRTGPDIYYVPGIVMAVVEASSALANDYAMMGEDAKAEKLYSRVSNIFANWYTATEWEEQVLILEAYAKLLRKMNNSEGASAIDKRIAELKAGGAAAAAKLTQERDDKFKAYEAAEAEYRRKNTFILEVKKDLVEGAILQAADFERRNPRADETVTREMLVRPDEAVQLEVARELKAGQILREKDLRAPTTQKVVACAAEDCKRGDEVKAKMEPRRVSISSAEYYIYKLPEAQGFKATKDIKVGDILTDRDLARTVGGRALKNIEVNQVILTSDYEPAMMPANKLESGKIYIDYRVAVKPIPAGSLIMNESLIDRHNCYPVAPKAIKKGTQLTIRDLKWVKGNRQVNATDDDSLPFDANIKLLALKDLDRGATINGATDMALPVQITVTEAVNTRLQSLAAAQKKSVQQVVEALVGQGMDSPLRWLDSIANDSGDLLKKPEGTRSLQVWLPNGNVRKMDRALVEARLFYYGRSQAEQLASHIVNLFTGPTGTVVVSKRDIPAGQIIKPEDLMERKLPASFIRSESKGISSAKLVAGKKCVYPIRSGSAIWADNVGVSPIHK